MSGIFDENLFGEAGLGSAPPDARPISEFDAFRSRFLSGHTVAANRLPTGQQYRSAGATSWRSQATGPGGSSQAFWFYSAAGTEVPGTHLVLPQNPANLPATSTTQTKEAAPYYAVPQTVLPAPLPGDGILPSPTGQQQANRLPWLPWVLVGGAVLAGGALVLTVARRPAPAAKVAPNRRRRHRRVVR